MEKSAVWPKLDDGNYVAWRTAMEIMLGGYDLDDLLVPKKPAAVKDVTEKGDAAEKEEIADEEDADGNDAAKEARRHKKAISKIALMLPLNKVCVLRGVKTVPAALKAIEATVADSNLTVRTSLRHQLENLHYKDLESTQALMDEMQLLVTKLRLTGEKIEDSGLMSKLSVLLPGDLFDVTFSKMTGTESFEEMKKLILERVNLLQQRKEAEKKRKAKMDEDLQVAAARFSTLNLRGGQQGGQSRDRRRSQSSDQPCDQQMTCWFCDEPGHVRFNCPEAKKMFRERRDVLPKPVVSSSNYIGSSSVVGADEDEGLLLDSGSTHQLASSRENIVNFQPMNCKVMLANDQCCDVIGIGDYVTDDTHLRDVLVVPALRNGIVSVSKLCDIGYEVLFTKDGARITKDGELIKVADRVGDLYRVYPSKSDYLPKPQTASVSKVEVTEMKPVRSEACYFCGEKGHVAVQCDALARTNCKKCGRLGHTRKYCEKAYQKEAAGLIADKPKQQLRSETNNWRKPAGTTVEINTKTRCKVTVGMKNGEGVVDADSDQTSFPDWMVETDEPPQCFAMPDGKHVFWMRGPVELEFTVNGITFVHPVYVHKEKEAIIGADLLNKYGGVIDRTTRSLMFSKPPMSKQCVMNSDVLRCNKNVDTNSVTAALMTAVNRLNPAVNTKKETQMTEPADENILDRRDVQRKHPTRTFWSNRWNTQRTPDEDVTKSICPSKSMSQALDKELQESNSWMDGLEMIDIIEDGPIQSDPKEVNLRDLLRLNTADQDGDTSSRTQELLYDPRTEVLLDVFLPCHGPATNGSAEGTFHDVWTKGPACTTDVFLTAN